ncbi:unnamed protein product [Diamesa serratosioi]
MPERRPLTNESGFMDLSLTIHTEDWIFSHIISFQTSNPDALILFFSLAKNNLARVPSSLGLFNITLQYLSLANNNFNDIPNGPNSQPWANFPVLNNLKELDIRNCNIEYLSPNSFNNLKNLEKLFLSHNLLKDLRVMMFAGLSNLYHLDISYNTATQFESSENTGGYKNVDPFSVYFEDGLWIDGDSFVHLQNLTFLDLSHSKLKQESVKAFTTLSPKIQQLSLCYTGIPLIINRMFAETNLKVLDLSGNPSLTPNLTPASFGGLENKLEILIFQNSNLKDMTYCMRNLRKLRMLDLAQNNINELTEANYRNYVLLEILILKSNHISNWYSRVFKFNEKLRIINLRQNNINLLTTQMMNDFNNVDFLAIGNNNFVCQCSLREFFDRATMNIRTSHCKRIQRKSLPEITEFPFENPTYHYDVFLREFHNYVKSIPSSKNKLDSYDNKRSNKKQDLVRRINLLNSIAETSNECYRIISEYENLFSHQPDNQMTNFSFRLLDLEENDYKCIDFDSLKRYQFGDLEACQEKIQGTYPAPTDQVNPDSTVSSNHTTPNYSPDDTSPLEHNRSINLWVICIPSGVAIIIIALIVWKRSEIKYFITIFKNSLILSQSDTETDKKFLIRNKNRGRNSNAVDSKDNFIYDVFVSYSNQDRDWVLDEFLTNIEKRSVINLCLHERDFQVGLSILENIISCMDQSRCLLLVISESFLSSNWCNFEMHLAQHRLIETRRENLILILLEEIPKKKMVPKTLQFLMRTKTYIVWPKSDKEEHRKIFWKRLKRAIIANNWEPDKKSVSTPCTTPRASIV